MPKILLLDGNSLTYRAFFALPTDMATAGGQVTNAVFGFTSMLINLVKDHQPDSIVAAFDRPEKTFRHEAVPTYKGNRDEAPDILRQQMGLVREVVDALGVVAVDLAGFEADDIIATLAEQAKARGDDVVIVTGDRDTYQLVEDPHVKVLYNRRGVSDYAFYDEAGIQERTGVPPTLYPQYAALRGDPSDNLPGVPGVGEKTAAKLITTYGGIDGIYEHLDAQTPKLRASLAEHEERVRENARVMVLLRDVPIEVDLDAAVLEPKMAEVKRLFEFLEFRSLLDRLNEALGAKAVGVAERDRRGGRGRGGPRRWRRRGRVAARQARPVRCGARVGRRRRSQCPDRPGRRARQLRRRSGLAVGGRGGRRLDPRRAGRRPAAPGPPVEAPPAGAGRTRRRGARAGHGHRHRRLPARPRRDPLRRRRPAGALHRRPSA